MLLRAIQKQFWTIRTPLYLPDFRVRSRSMAFGFSDLELDETDYVFHYDAFCVFPIFWHPVQCCFLFSYSSSCLLFEAYWRGIYCHHQSSWPKLASSSLSSSSSSRNPYPGQRQLQDPLSFAIRDHALHSLLLANSPSHCLLAMCHSLYIASFLAILSKTASPDHPPRLFLVSLWTHNRGTRSIVIM